MKGHIVERSPGHFAIVLDLKVGGARKRKWHSFKGTKREAQIECARLIAAMDEGAYVEKNKLTVKQFLSDRLAAWEAAKRITPRSVERYRELIDNQIVPHLGAKLLQSLKPIDIEDWHAKLISSGRLDGKGGLSPRSIGHAHRLLTRMLKEAQRFELVVKNAAVGSESLPKVNAAEVQIVGETQLPVLLEKIKGHKIEPIVLLALFCGLRRSEILPLKWGNIDLDRSVLRVRHSFEETRAGGVRFKEPKSRAGRRDVTMPDVVVAVLRRHRIEQLELRAKLGLGRPGDDDLVFWQLNGQPIGPRHFSANVWPAAAREIGMSEITFHALRHTHASQLIAAGVDVVTISKRLGHSSPNITLGVYAHLFSASDEKAAKAINAALGKLGSK
jgi:integrase